MKSGTEDMILGNKTAKNDDILPTDHINIYKNIIGMEYISWKSGFLTF